MNREYEAAPYKGKQWGLFHKPTRNWTVFGTRRAMQTRALELNNLNNPPLAALRYHVTGAIERGEAVAITAI